MEEWVRKQLAAAEEPTVLDNTDMGGRLNL